MHPCQTKAINDHDANVSFDARTPCSSREVMQPSTVFDVTNPSVWAGARICSDFVNKYVFEDQHTKTPRSDVRRGCFPALSGDGHWTHRKDILGSRKVGLSCILSTCHLPPVISLKRFVDSHGDRQRYSSAYWPQLATL